MHTIHRIIRPASVALALLAGALHAEEIDLSGAWRVSLGDPAAGAAAWREIQLPGTLDDAGLGAPVTLAPELSRRVLTRLQRKVTHTGPAWYEREVDLPADWAGRRVELELERVLWRSTVFVDGRECSQADSLSAPHRHDLGPLAPGRHTLRLVVDNRDIHPGASRRHEIYSIPEDKPLAHAYTNHTQIIWNGALGRLRLRALALERIEKLAVTASATPGSAPRLRAAIALSAAAAKRGGVVKLALRRRGAPEAAPLAELRQPFAADPQNRALLVDWPAAALARTNVEPWDEFSPALHELAAEIEGVPAGAARAVFGFRELAVRDGRFSLNGRRIFLRGNLECMVFPLTGRPPTDTAAWRTLMSKAKAWGLNHLRFHSWCPPEAAFDAADELGLYLQIELPHWNGEKPGRSEDCRAFLEAEGRRILDAYGNHPSFMFFSMGNELKYDWPWVNGLVNHLRAADQRRLYTTTSYSTERPRVLKPEPADDYFVTQQVEGGGPLRGQKAFFNDAPAFDVNYAADRARVGMPLVLHELGQWAVFPDLAEIPRYTGNLVPLNFIAVRDDLAKKGLLALAPDFTRASGRLSALLYKEEIERALRTPGMDGFQLLSLQDFPGQGTALVGLLNAFWEPKAGGLISAENFRSFCSPVVPLATFPRATYERGETFRAELQVANFLRDFPRAELHWTLRNTAGATLAAGATGPFALPVGNGVARGAAEFRIPAAGPAECLTLEVALAGTGFRNSWRVWVYPPAGGAADATPENVLLTDNFADAQRALAAGRRVLLAPPPAAVNGLNGVFPTVFWSPVHFSAQAASVTMGLLCDPAHPALRDFPTDFHSDWQWWEPVVRSKTIVIDNLPVTPLVRVIDNFTQNRALANIFETRVGPGRLLFCAIDINADLATRPAARQLRRSLLRYAASDAFAPAPALTSGQLAALATPPPPDAATASKWQR